MRDYAEIGWRVRSGGRRRRGGAEGWLARAWAGAASPVTTTALLFVVAGLLLLEARGSGPVLPVADPGRMTPLALRVALALLGTNLVALFLARVVPVLARRRGRAAALAPELALEARAALPPSPRDVALERVLELQGVHHARRASERRVVGVRGTLALLGASVAVLGGGCVLAALIAGLDDPASGELALLEGEPVETARYDTASADPLEVFLGPRFVLRGTDRLIEALVTEPHGDAADADGAATIEVEHPDGGVERVALRPASPIGLDDGTWLRLASVREIGSVAAKVRVVPPGAQADAIAPERVRLGGALQLDSMLLTVSDLRNDFMGSLGPALELRPQQGRPFWIFADAPGLGSDWPHLEGHRIELVELERNYVVTLERFAPQDATLPMVGLALLVLGGCLLLVTSHLAVEVHDEVDRVVVRTSSVNNALGAEVSGEAIAAAVVSALEAPDDPRWAVTSTAAPDNASDNTPDDVSDDVSDDAPDDAPDDEATS